MGLVPFRYMYELRGGSSTPVVVASIGLGVRVVACLRKGERIFKVLVAFAVGTCDAAEGLLAVLREEVHSRLGAAMHSEEAFGASPSMGFEQAVCQRDARGIPPEDVAELVPRRVRKEPDVGDGQQCRER